MGISELTVAPNLPGLNIWSPVGGAVWGRLNRGAALLEEAHHLGLAFRGKITHYLELKLSALC